MSKVVINIGGTGTGKTTLTKNIARKFKKKIIVFDINNEYKEEDFNSISEEPEEAVKIISEKKNTTFIFEEATFYLRAEKNISKLLKHLVIKRHTGNNFIFNFHSVRSVPSYLFDYCDLINLKKTRENKTIVLNKYKEYPELIKAFNEVELSSFKFFTYSILR